MKNEIIITSGTIINPHADILIRDGDGWKDVNRRFMAGHWPKPGRVYVTDGLPDAWMQYVNVGGAIIDMPNKDWAFDGFGWYRKSAEDAGERGRA